MIARIIVPLWVRGPGIRGLDLAAFTGWLSNFDIEIP
jgi:hypothetical protein